MSGNHSVSVAKFAEQHHIKDFSKKHKGAWDITLRALIYELQHMDALLLTNIAEIIADSEQIRICKIEFRIAGTKHSRHASGNRCIVAVHANTKHVFILFVYHKNNLSESKNETEQWKRIVKNQYPEYKDIL